MPKHPVYITRAIQNKAEQTSKDTMYLSGLIPMGTFNVRVRSCLPPALPGFPEKLTSPFQSLGCNLQSHSQSGPQHKTIKILEEDIGSKVSDIACSNILSDIFPRQGK